LQICSSPPDEDDRPLDIQIAEAELDLYDLERIKSKVGSDQPLDNQIVDTQTLIARLKAI